MVVGEWLPGDGNNIVARRVTSEGLHGEVRTVSYTEQMLQVLDCIGENTPDWWRLVPAQQVTVEPLAPSHEETPPLIPTPFQYLKVNVLIDPELGRLAIALRQFPLFRIWCYAHLLEGGPGWIEKATLYENLLHLNLEISWREFNHLLSKGNGLYWTVAWATLPNGEYTQRIYLRSPIKMASRLTRRTLRQNPALVATNRPGRRRVDIDLTGIAC